VIPDPVPDAPITPEPPAIYAPPSSSLRPKARPADRVSDTPQAPPPDQAVEAPDRQDAASPDADSAEQADEAQEQTAPPETATEIVTEAEQPSGSLAPTSSRRPPAGRRPAPEAEPEPEVAPEPEPEPEVVDEAADAIAAALEEALSADLDLPEEIAPMTASESNDLRLAVQACWVVDVGSRAANVKVTLGFEMDRDGTVFASTIQMIGASGGDAAAIDTAYRAARRAVLRCQGPEGYDLPPEKYDQWRMIEMTFNPESMRLR
jgi:hypothetical protein